MLLPYSSALPGETFSVGRHGYALRRVQTRNDWAVVRALRSATLARRGDIASEATGYGDRHDEAPNAATFLLSRDGRPLGSTRTSVALPHGGPRLPAHDAFAAELDAAAGPDAVVVEAGLTVIDPSAPDAAAALFHLFKAHMLACAVGHASWLVTAVRDVQMGFYRRMFNMEILSGAEPVPGLSYPRVLMGLRYREQAALLFKRIPILALSVGDEREFAATGAVSFGAERGRARAGRATAVRRVSL